MAAVVGAAGLVLATLLAGCSGQRPTLADAATPTSGAGTATSASTAPTSTVPVVRSPSPSTMIGYIATPTGTPIVYAGPETNTPALDIGTTTDAGAPTTFAVVGDPTLPDTNWYQVLLPTRPNQGVGWVPALSVTLTKTPLRVFVDLANHTLTVQDDGKEVLSAPVAIGTAENPTPKGASYVTELIQNVDPDGAYGPYAFGLALHSDTLTEFNGGPGQVGIHGTNEPSKIGQDVSHGCVRLSNDDIERLVDLQLPLGVPVFIS